MCGKTFFACRFIRKENFLFRLTISYPKLFVFSVSALCFHKFTVKLLLRPKMGLIYAKFYSKMDFWNFLL